MRQVKTLWGIIAVLFLCVLVLILLLLRQAATATEPPASGDATPPEARVIARLGEREFTYEELLGQLERLYGPEVLRQMLEHEAIGQEAKALGIAVNAAEIEKELQRMQSGYESEEQFYKTMQEQLGLTPEDLRKDTYYKLLGEKIATRGINVTDSELDQYIAAHAEEFHSYIQYRLSKIVVATFEEAQSVIDELADGASFEQLARERSLDEETAATGGDLGWLDADDPTVSPIILGVAASLQPGEVSRPIQLDIGYALLRMDQKKEVRRGPDRAAREALRHDLILAKAPPVREVVRQLREKYGETILDPDFR